MVMATDTQVTDRQATRHTTPAVPVLATVDPTPVRPTRAVVTRVEATPAAAGTEPYEPRGDRRCGRTV